MKLFCGLEEPKGSEKQASMDGRLAKKTGWKEATGCCRLEANSPPRLWRGKLQENYIKLLILFMTINLSLSTMHVAVNYAYDREKLYRNPFRKIKQAAETPKEKGVNIKNGIFPFILCAIVSSGELAFKVLKKPMSVLFGTRNRKNDGGQLTEQSRITAV